MKKIDQNLDCIYYINSNLLISFIDESRKIKAASRTSSYRWKGEQTFIIYVSYLYVTRYGSHIHFWFLIEKFKKLPLKHFINWSNLFFPRGLPEERRRLSTEQPQQTTKNYRVPSKNCQWTIFLALKRLVSA